PRIGRIERLLSFQPMQSIVVGIDGGGTKTRAILADERGERIAESVGAGSAVRPQEVERSAGIIAGVVRDAIEAADLESTRPRVLCVGVAGVGRDAERQALWESLAAYQIADEVIVVTDLAVALEDAFGEGPGILLIAGTG